MSVHALTQIDPTQFFRLPSTNGTGTQRLDTQVSGVAVTNDFSGRLSVTTAEGDTITLSADLESDFRAVHDTSSVEGNGTTVDVDATYAEYSMKHEFGITIEGDLNEEEVKDLARLFRKVANIFTQYASGQDDEALAKAAKLAERFGNLSSLSGLDLSVDVERSVTVLAAQVASEVTGLPALPIDRLPQTPVTTTHTVTPGGAPSTAAAIPQPSTGTTAPTPLSTTSSVTNPTTGAHLSAPASETQKPRSLVQQILEALEEAGLESRKVQKYLPDFLKKLREDLEKELKGEQERQSDQPANQAQTSETTRTSAAFAYQAVRQTSIALSIRS
ncbi:MAG: hypothetical protein EHM80_03175 [Nitrospiraceae bacterium]|nr:MAG: hypothetical protein EHM80_03175 [Nitrospiraceae bacterium]